MNKLKIAGAALAIALTGTTATAPAANAYVEYYEKSVRCYPFTAPAKMYYAWYKVRKHTEWEKFWGLKDFRTYSHSTILDFYYRPHPVRCNAFGYPLWS